MAKMGLELTIMHDALELVILDFRIEHLIFLELSIMHDVISLSIIVKGGDW